MGKERPILPNPRMEVRNTLNRERRTELKTKIVSNLVDGMLAMESPDGSDLHKHGQLIVNTARLDAKVIGWDPIKPVGIATHILEERKAEERRAEDHRMLRQEQKEEDWEIIHGEFPGQFAGGIPKLDEHDIWRNQAIAFNVYEARKKAETAAKKKKYINDDDDDED